MIGTWLLIYRAIGSAIQERDNVDPNLDSKTEVKVRMNKKKHSNVFLVNPSIYSSIYLAKG